MPIASSIAKPASPTSTPVRPAPLRTDLGPASAKKKRKPGSPRGMTDLSAGALSPFGAAPEILESLAAVAAPMPTLAPVRTVASAAASVLESPILSALGSQAPAGAPTRREAGEADPLPATATSTDTAVAEAAPVPKARAQDAASRKSQEPQESTPKETVTPPETGPHPAAASGASTVSQSSVANGKTASPKPAGSDTASEPGETAEKSSKTRSEAPQSSSAATSGAPSGSGPIAATPAAVKGPGPTATATSEPAPDAGEPAAASEDSAGVTAESAPPQPARDAGLQATVAGVQAAAATQRAHAPPGAKAAEATAAAQGPPGEVAAMAGARQVGVMDQQEAPPFNREAFVAQLTGRIEEVTPKTLDEADKFKENNRVGGLTGVLATAVEKITGGSAGNVAQATQAAPDQAGIEPKPVTELPPAVKAAKPVVATDAAVPAPASDERISLEAESRTLDDQMAKGGITRTQLEKSNEPTFQSALAAKDAAQQSAAAAPGEYRAAEKQTLDTARGENAAAVSQQLDEMSGVRGQTLGNVLGKQGGAKSEEEAKRVEITQAIQGIYDQTKTDVEARLAKLDGEVNSKFESAAKLAQSTFEEHVEKRLAEYKKKRYEGIIGAFLEVKDVFGLPSEVNAFYVEGKQRYIDAMKSSINDIATLVESGLLEAKARIATGKKQVADYVQSQPKALQKIAKQAAGTIGAQFDQLEQGVNDKQNQIVDGLVARYQENLKSLDERIEKLKEKNKGVIGSALDAMAGVAETIGELATTLRGLLAKIGDVVTAIVADPIGFLDNLVTGVSTGLKNFVNNIAGHMKEGFFAWLFGAMAAAGITMPAQWDLKGVFGLLMQILGATYNFIRSRAVSLVGEKVVSTIETTATFFQKLATDGPISLWEDLKESLGNVVQTAIDGIKTFLTETVIKAGIQWLLSLLTPASAFVKAAKTIIDVVTFFFTRGKQVMELVTAIVDSIAAIAKGSLGAAAQFVEKSLAKALPVAIGFLASLIGLGGLTERIQKLMAQLQKPIMKAIDWIIARIVKIAKSAGRKLGRERKEKSDSDGNNSIHEAASLRVRQQLGTETTLDEAKMVLPRILGELKPSGLKGLEITDSDSDGTVYILSEASPKRRAAVLAGESANVIVAISARITLAEDGKDLETEMLNKAQDPRFPDERLRYEKVEGRRAAAALGVDTRPRSKLHHDTAADIAPLPHVSMPPKTPARHGDQPSAGYIIPHRKNRTIEVLAWNTGRRIRDSNVSHAEHQFVKWFWDRPSAWMRRIESIEIEVDGLEPCDKGCAAELKSLKRYLQTQHKHIELRQWPAALDANGNGQQEKMKVSDESRPKTIRRPRNRSTT